MTTAVVGAGDGRVAGLRERTRATTVAAAPVVAAALAPVLLFGWRALHAPINFDGAMNLQVAARLAVGDGYTRAFGDVEAFPHEVQTNGPFIYVAALLVRVLGTGLPGLQAANLLFVGVCAALVAVLLRDHPVLRLVGPALALLGVPSIAIYALGGLGEVPTTAFLLAAVLALAAALRSPERAPQWVFGAAVAFGAALATKTFAIGAAAGLGAGLVPVLLAAPGRRDRVRVVLATSGVAVLPAVRELHRLLELGSVGGYRHWWDVERAATSDQSGLEDSGGNLVSTFFDHLDELARQVGQPALLVAAFLFLPLVWVAVVVGRRWRHKGLVAALRDPHLAVLVMLAGLAGTYVLWWLCLLPEAKLWVRRMLPGLVALHVLYLFMVPALVAGVRRRDLGRWPRVAGIAALLGVVVAVVPYGWARLDRNGHDLVEGQTEWLAAEREAADQVRAGDDLRWYGDGWWSAPGVSLLADTDLRDFAEVADEGGCDVDPDRDRLVWDLDARLIAGHPSTRDDRFTFTEVANHRNRIRIYAIGCT